MCGVKGQRFIVLFGYEVNQFDLPTKLTSSITVTKISLHFTYKMAAKTAAVDMKQNYVTFTVT